MSEDQSTDVLRSLIRARRAAGWTHRPYGGGRHQDHVWTAPSTTDPTRTPRNTIRPRKVTLYEGELEYRNAGASKIAATIRPESMAEVVGWLRLLGLLPTIAQVAEALLDADGADERSSTPNAVGAPSDRHMSEVGA
jgi:hypothetical protein